MCVGRGGDAGRERMEAALLPYRLPYIDYLGPDTTILYIHNKHTTQWGAIYNFVLTEYI